MSRLRTYFPQLVLAATVLILSAFALGAVATQRGVDFAVYYLTAQALRRGMDIYTLTGADFTRLAAQFQITNFTAPYLYPPLTAGGVLGLSWLPYPIAFAIWNLLSVAAVIGSGLALSRYTARRWINPAVFLLLLLWIPIYTTLYAGQVNNFILLSVVLYIVWSTRRTFYRSGLVLAIGLLIKPLTASLVLHLTWRREWSRLRAVGIGLIVAVLITLLLAGAASVLNYVHLGSGTFDLADPLAAYPPKQSIFAFWGRAFTSHSYGPPLIANPPLGLLLSLITSVLLMGGVAFLTWPRKSQASDTFALETGLVLVTGNLVLPLMWYHHLAVIAVAVILAWQTAGRGLRACLAMALILIAAQGLLWSRLVGHTFLLSLGTYGLLIIYAITASLIWSAKRTQPANGQ